jgi:hypothetical protein
VASKLPSLRPSKAACINIRLPLLLPRLLTVQASIVVKFKASAFRRIRVARLMRDHLCINTVFHSRLILNARLPIHPPPIPFFLRLRLVPLFALELHRIIRLSRHILDQLQSLAAFCPDQQYRPYILVFESRRSGVVSFDGNNIILKSKRRTTNEDMSRNVLMRLMCSSIKRL